MKRNMKKVYAKVCAAVMTGILACSGFPLQGAAGEKITPSEYNPMPAAFDLRDLGLVTDVKDQTPFGTCWAFGSASAAESSLLTYLGVTAEEAWDKEELRDLIDISEKHLVWFAYNPITAEDSPSQAGEGIVYGGSQKDTTVLYNEGADALITTTVFANGAGPALEKDFPYQGDSGLSEGEWLSDEANHDAALQYEKTARGMVIAMALKMTPEEQIEKYGRSFKDEDDVASYYLQADIEYYTRYPSVPSSHDDWSIDAGCRTQVLPYVMKNGNILPPFVDWKKDENGNQVYDKPNEDGKRAVKRELMKGHAVAMGYASDHSLPGQVESGKYMNLDNWAQYTYEPERSTHEVCIVGWDDNFPRENFQTWKEADAEAELPEGAVVRENGKTYIPNPLPKENGAWIVKNSWGSKDTNGSAWGVDGSGYFYLSYEDQSMEGAESYEFTANLEGEPVISQLNYALPFRFFYKCGFPAKDGIVKTANIFTSEEHQLIKSLSANTRDSNDRLFFEVYILDEDDQAPTDGKLTARVSEVFEYEGYHRVDLDTPIELQKGQRFAVVTRDVSTDLDGSMYYGFETAFGARYTEDELKSIAESGEGPVCSVVCNKGESLLYKDGKWTDLTEFDSSLPKRSNYDEMYLAFIRNNQGESDTPVLDNFPIKAYGVKVDDGKPLVRANTFLDGTASIISQVSADGKKIVVPETVSSGGRTYTVTSIEVGAFSDKANSKVSSVTIPAGVLTVNEGAFRGLKKLEKTVFRNKDTNVLAQAFQGANKKCTVIVDDLSVTTGKEAKELKQRWKKMLKAAGLKKAPVIKKH